MSESKQCFPKRCFPKRCFWCNEKNAAYLRYHDEEWGVPCHDDGKLFELLLLESFQAGLSWECILNKREAFRAAFDGFHAATIARYDDAKCDALAQDAGIVRNRRKIRAAVSNAHVFLQIQEEYGSFDRYLWAFTDGAVVCEPCDAYCRTPLSDRISADLKRQGMTFVGSTIIYSYLQAVGVVNGHTQDCFLSPLAEKSEM